MIDVMLASAGDVQAHLTFGAALVLGVFFVILAHKLRMSAIVILLLGGILVGPNGIGLIDPEVLGSGLSSIIALAVGVILFEGGLSLDPRGYKEASREIKGILSVGVATTWCVTACILRLLQPSFGWKYCFLIASLIIVTGPTVIGPLLKRIQVRTKIHHILHWEGVLIDPIGVFIALLCFKLVLFTGDGGMVEAVRELGTRVAVGLAGGLAGGFTLTYILRRKWVPEESLNIFVLAYAIGIFSLSDFINPESGLLTVTIAGFFVGYMDLPQVRKLRAYKAELIELLIGLLFVLLAARLNPLEFKEIGWGGLVAVLAVMFLVRPLNIFLSTIGSSLKTKDKLFLSWIGPRGIVAASMASLFALRLMRDHPSEARFLEAFTYSVIAGTVLFQGFTAGIVGRFLNVLEPKATGWLVVGAHRLAREIAVFIKKQGSHVVLVDANPRSVALAKRQGLAAICDTPLAVDPDVEPDLYNIGNLLAITEFGELNNSACVRFRNESAKMKLYKWSPSEETGRIKDADLVAGQGIWDVFQYRNLHAIELDEGIKNLETITSPVTQIRHPERALICSYKGDIYPGIPEEAAGDVTAIIYQPFALKLELNIRPEWVIYSNSDSLPELFGELLNCLKSDYPELAANEIRNQLIKQENEYSSLVGYDVALPHFHLEDIDESVVLIAKMKTPLEDQHSGDPIRFVFLVLSPSEHPRAHLNSLSEISRFIMEEQNRDSLEEVNSVDELKQVFFP